MKLTTATILLAGTIMSLSADAAQLTFINWGGSMGAAEEATTSKPFTQATGVQVKSDTYNGGIAQVRAQVQTSNVTWDVIDLQLSDAVRACDEGLLEKINPASLAPAKDGTTARADYVPEGLSDCLAGNISWSTLIVYNSDKFKGNAPTRIADFFDVKKFPGKRGLRKSPEGALEWALLADGVQTADVYKVLATPTGLARAFKKLDTIKSSIIWWEAGAQPAQLLADGEVTMTSAYNGRIYDAIETDHKPFAFLWDGQVKNIDGYAIVKGTKNLKAAQDFVQFGTRPDVLAKLASKTAYGPLRKSALPQVDPKVAPFLPTAPENQKGALTIDANFWADRSDDLNQKFAVWLAQK